MRPILFQVTIPGWEPIAVPAYSFMIMLSFVLGTLLARKWARVRGINPVHIGDLALVAIFGAIVGSRAAYVLDFWQQFVQRPWWHMLAIWEGGLVFYGGFLGAASMIFLVLFLRKLDWRQLTDILTPQVALGLGLTRIGCYLNGCCCGQTCSAHHPLGITFPPGSHCFTRHQECGLIGPHAAASLPVYPTQLISSAFDFALFALLSWLLWKYAPRRRGIVFLTFLLLYPAFRFTIELIRDEPRTLFHLTAAQQTSLLLFVPAALTALIWLRRSMLASRPRGSESVPMVANYGSFSEMASAS